MGIKCFFHCDTLEIGAIELNIEQRLIVSVILYPNQKWEFGM